MSMIYFWKPQWYWFGWRTLVPFFMGEDPDGRRTLVLGWTVTGRMLIRLWMCKDPVCMKQHWPDNETYINSL